MIFVTLGTQDKSFTRMLDIIDKAIVNGIIKDKVIVQSGYTKYYSKNMEIFDYIDSDRFLEIIRSSDVLITHAGVGNIFTGLENNKKVMAIPRLSEYKEHSNDHQLDIVNKFREEGYILSFSTYDEFVDNYKKIDSFVPKKYESNTLNMISLIKNYIDNN